MKISVSVFGFSGISVFEKSRPNFVPKKSRPINLISVFLVSVRPNLEEPRQRAETTPVMWRRRAKVAVRRDGSGNRRGSVEAEGGDDAGDVKVEGGGGDAARWI